VADKQPPISELAAKAEVAWRDLLVAQSQVLQSDHCCLNDSWRGHLCSYHQGYADGIDAVLEQLHIIKAMTSGR
jgi:hypothetical protein